MINTKILIHLDAFASLLCAFYHMNPLFIQYKICTRVEDTQNAPAYQFSLREAAALCFVHNKRLVSHGIC